uniref:Phosphomannose isomerase type I catalytic domain-containing protein n=1 Tax=Ditylenchus dipsaci TaxID=166011 RepID=A0A915E4V8_9BILA
MERLDCTVKEYAWGKDGHQSEVARLFSAATPIFKLGKKLLMLSYGSEPTQMDQPDNPSHSYLFNNSSREQGQQKKPLDDVHLPFIMKIMSIKHTLSLQVHPTKEQAAILHKKDPVNYPDRNHKPELAYALTRFELLCGFRPAHQIAENMKVFPELRKVMGENNCDKFEQLTSSNRSGKELEDKLKTALRKCFATMLDQQLERPKMVEEQLKSLYRRIDANVRGCLIEDTVRVMKDTYERFPTDVAGECCFYAAEELHAYLSGECVECPPHIVEYAPDCKDFTLHQITIEPSCTSSNQIELPALECASMLVVVEGEAQFQELDGPIIQSENNNNNTSESPPKCTTQSSGVKRGDIYYIPAGRVVCFTSVTSRLLGYRTFSFETGPDHSNRLTSKQTSVATTPMVVEKKGKEKVTPLKVCKRPS